MAAPAPTPVSGKSNFYVENSTCLNKANYYFGLDGVMVAAYSEKILIGPTETNENGEVCFDKNKTIIVPTSKLVEFVTAIRKGYEALKAKSKEEFEDTILIYQNTHYLVGKYQCWQGEYGFTLFYKWKFGADKYFKKLVDEGKRDPVNVSNLADPQFQPLKRGVFNLKLSDMELIMAHMDILFQYLSYDLDTNKRRVLEFIEYATNEEKHAQFLKTQLSNYYGLTCEEKIKLLRTILTEMMMRDKNQPLDSFELRSYLDVLTRKMVPIYALLHFHLFH